MFRRWLSTLGQESPKTKGIPRFWKQVAIETSDSSRVAKILLDGRPVRSPSGSPLEIPSQNSLLSLLVAGEWEAQRSGLKSYSLPLTSLVARSQDAFSRPGLERQEAIDKLVKYLHTDAICYHQPFPESFVKLQEEYWIPILNWLKTDEKLTIKSTDESLPPLHLAAFERIVLSSKSICLAYALYKRRIGVEFAAKAARLEALHQTEKWGEVEDSHDTDREDMKRQLGSAMVLLIESS